MFEARRDILCLIGVAEKPGLSVGTMKPRTVPSSARAQMIATSAMSPLVIHILVPSSRQAPPGVCLAVVRIAAASDPLSGSVSPKHPIVSPVAMDGSQCSFCSSDPNAQMGYIAREPWTLMNDRIPVSPASSSKAASPYSTADVPAHPYPSRCIPSRPRLPISLARSRGRKPSSNQRPMFGSISLRTQAATVSRTNFS